MMIVYNLPRGTPGNARHRLLLGRAGSRSPPRWAVRDPQAAPPGPRPRFPGTRAGAGGGAPSLGLAAPGGRGGGGPAPSLTRRCRRPQDGRRRVAAPLRGAPPRPSPRAAAGQGIGRALPGGSSARGHVGGAEGWRERCGR